MMDLSRYLPQVITIARGAGKLILDCYQHHQYQAFTKADDTPVTSADLAAHQFILEQLQQLTPDIPVLSEEATDISFQQRQLWERYWLVDPLDGTQEFIARSGDFATVIALVEHNQPIMGVVYAPTSDVSYYAYAGQGAWKITSDQQHHAIHCHHHTENTHQITLAISRRQNIRRIHQHLTQDWHYDLIPLGSAALKACLVAEGAADGYLRLGPTGEWDTAATQCIVQEAGGQLLSTDFDALTYNLRSSLENPNFIVLGDPNLPWQRILLMP